MSLLTNCNEGTPGADYFINSVGGGTIITGNPVQLCTAAAGSPAPVAASGGGLATIRSSGTTLTLGTVNQGNMIGLTEGTPDFIFINESAGMTGTGQNFEIRRTNALVLAAGSQAVVSQAAGGDPAASVTVQNGGVVALLSGAAVNVAAGASVDFNAASAQKNTYDSTVVVGAVPNAATTPITTPAGIPDGTYAVMLTSGVPGDAANIYNVNAMCSFAGGIITFGGVGSVDQGAGQLRLIPNGPRNGLAIENQLAGGVALAGCSVRFVMVVRD